MFKLSTAAAVLCCTIAAPVLCADIVVSSFPDWNGAAGINPVGPGHAALGQTFTAPGGATALDTVRTRIDLAFSANGVRVYIFAMSGDRPTGSALYRSDPIVDPGLPNGTFSLLEFTGIGAAVTPGQEYVVLFSCGESLPSRLTNSIFATASAGAASPLLGRIIMAPIPTLPPDEALAFLAAATYSTVLPPRDLAIELTFIPAPTAAGLLGLGVLAACRRRR